MTDDAPKSAYELAMEKLRAQDDAAGAAAAELTAAQVEAIAAARRDYEAKVAECRILHESTLAATVDPAAVDEQRAHYRRDLARYERDRDRTIERIRGGGPT